MPSIFSKNCILVGHLDFYCLTCGEYYKNEEEAFLHVTLDTKHDENLKSCGYFEKYKNDLIWKIKGVYFCELCNITFPTTTKVRLHVAEKSHILAKESNNNRIVRMNNELIAFNRFVITEEAWNSVIDDTCVLCNAEFDNYAVHKTSQNHILKLIQSEVIYGDNESISRKVDDKLHQCLTCNILVSQDELTHHFNSVQHVNTRRIKYPQLHSKSKLKKVDDSQDIVGNGNDAKPNKANIQNTQGMNEIGVKDKPKQSVNTSKTNSNGNPDHVYCKKLGAKDYIVNICSGEWCVVCEWSLDVPAAEHIQSKHHQTLLKMHKERIEINANRKNNDNKSNLLEFSDRYQKNNINVDLINETVYCKKCSKNIDFNTDAIEKHIVEHNKKKKKITQETSIPVLSSMKSNGNDGTKLFTKPVLLTDNQAKSSTSRSTKLEDFAKQHGLSHNSRDNSFYCNACNRRLSTTLQELENHVSSNGHKNNISKRTKKQIVIKKEPVNTFIENIAVIESVDEVNIIINNKLWINAYNFCLLSKHGYKIICDACEIDLIPENVFTHMLTSETHGEVIGKCLFITSLENECIREIRLDTYHCGYCNTVVTDWDDMLEHVTNQEHKNMRKTAEHRLRNHTRIQGQHPTVDAENMDELMRVFAERFGFRRL